MKEIKREYLPLYSFYDRSGIAKHLEDMAARGWLLEKLSSWCWQRTMRRYRSSIMSRSTPSPWRPTRRPTLRTSTVP